MMHLTLTYLRSQAYVLQTQVSSSQGDANTLSGISPEYNISKAPDPGFVFCKDIFTKSLTVSHAIPLCFSSFQV
jgi:hypothetical protein